MTQQSRSPAPNKGREATNGSVMTAPKVAPLPALIFIPSKTLAMACVNFIITTPTRLTGVLHLVLGRKLAPAEPPSIRQHTHTTHATAMHFPANAGLIFLTDELTNNRYLVDTGATMSIVPRNQNSSPSGPLLKGADGQPIPSWGFIKKKLQFQGKLFTSSFLQAAVAGSILGIDFWRKFKVTVVPDINQIQFACTTAAPPAPFLPSAVLPDPFLFSAASSAPSCLFSSPPVLALVLTPHM
jgi:hypothetical protein